MPAYDLNIRFPRREPRPQRPHHFLNICALTFAAALMSLPFGGNEAIFGVLAGLFVLLYVLSTRHPHAGSGPES